MKIKRTSNNEQRTLNIECGVCAAANSFGVRRSAFDVQCSPRSRRGVALIITLILLSVVTFMAITFLALSKRERSAVTTVTDTAGARLAADAALANAEAQIIANALSTTNPYNFSLLVSTNYINTNGFDPVNVNPFENINYDHLLNGSTPLSQIQFLTLLTNLWYSPRPPVFIPTNSAGANDFRFYLDLNRNGRDDPNGLVPNVDVKGVTNGTISEVGDPEWIGVLERPDAPHGPNNKFIARYAFIAVPVGNTLDLNAIHNEAHAFHNPPSQPPGYPNAEKVNPSQSGDNDNFVRNEGVGSWEINLAAFLADLNTNEWDPPLNPYVYQNIPYNNIGYAFDDARALLTYRYNNDFRSLTPISKIFSPVGVTAFTSDNIDGYTYGSPLMIGFELPGGLDPDFNLRNLPWVGTDNTNHFFTHQELFDPTKTEINVGPPGFIEHLNQAGTNVSTYDRYTFYRMLSQLGTDSAPDSGKMNLNYDNINPYVFNPNGIPVLSTNGVAASTNFVAWTPLGFFTNAADRLLRAYTTQWRNNNPTNFAATFYSVTDFTNIIASQWTTNYLPFGITNIPVLVSNQFVYSSAVNRLLQLAANMYDATTTNYPGVTGNNYPSVFRPIFEHDNFGNVFIVGYTNLYSSYGTNTVSGTNDAQLAMPHDVTQLFGLTPANFTPITDTYGYVNVYGVPWIIGAKKGFPNFNKFGLQNVVQITRKLQIWRSTIPTTKSTVFATNQLYVFSVSNSIGVECWNSYGNPYPNPVQIVARDNITMLLTNNLSATPWYFPTYPSPYPRIASITTNFAGFLPGYANSFVIPINDTAQFLTNSGFYFGTSPPGVSGFDPVGNNPGWETNKTDFSIPQFVLLTTNRLQLFMLDGNHVIDYVQFAGPQSIRNLNAEFQTSLQTSGYDNMWSIALNSSGAPWGIVNQIDESDHATISDPVWAGQDPTTVEKAMDGLSTFMGLTGVPYPQWTNDPAVIAMQTNYVMQVHCAPTVMAYEYTSWQANDPLVHYLASDLTFIGIEANNAGPSTGTHLWTSYTTPLPRPSFNTVNDRYQPWGEDHLPAGADQNPCNLAYKDPLVRMSDNWDFPTNKFPTVGWLGRVHRGTPWQSVYLKASDILIEANQGNNIGTNTWVNWTGDANLYDATNMAPVKDRLLFDLFTTAFNDNATRGTLSVNQNHLAAWSALFSGVVAISNNAPDNSSIRYSSHPQYQNPPPSNSWMIIQPAGPAWTNSPLGQLVNGINQTRAAFTNADGLVGSFEHAGDILSTLQLTEQSPFLHWYNGTLSDGVQITNGISDEMYEWLPQQTMSLLRCANSPRYVIYCYGQTLKPAPNSIYTGGGPFFGMVTNYQIVSEIATRAVVRFNSMVTQVYPITADTNGNWYSVPVVTNNNAVIENFNILPPD
jgi:hypothetical protein